MPDEAPASKKKMTRKSKIAAVVGAIGAATLAAWHFLFGAGAVPTPPPPALEAAVEAVVVPPAVPVETAVPPVEGSEVE